MDLGAYFTHERLAAMVQAVAILVVGWMLARTAAAAVMRLVRRTATPQGALLTRRLVYYSLLGLAVFLFLEQLGFQLSVLLGAAGILTVAVGFASQTSASNLISGLFLIAERPFAIGDVIKVGGVTGEVLSVDLLSTKIRTFDNLFVRVPNESIIKSEVTNMTHFPIRRFDMKIGVAYKEDLQHVKDVLFDTAARNPLCLVEPAPLFIILGFGESSLEMQFSVWAVRDQWLEMRNLMHQEIKAAFAAAGIEIPFPHRSLYAGSRSEPFPVRIMEQAPSQQPPVDE